MGGSETGGVEGGLPPIDPEALAERFEVLANPRRLRLLRLLTEPHYLREIASHVGISRQATQRHLDRLVDEGLLTRRSASRESGPVTEYLVVPEALAAIHDEIEALGGLRPRADPSSPPTRRGTEDRPIEPPPGPALWVVRGLDAGASLSLAAGGESGWLLGRDPECDLVFEADPFASAKHAEVWRSGSTIRLSDLASTNGTFLNGTRIDRGEEPELVHGDIVAVGRSLVTYQEE